MEPWWRSGGTLPPGRPGPPQEPIWAETPKLSAVGEKWFSLDFPPAHVNESLDVCLPQTPGACGPVRGLAASCEIEAVSALLTCAVVESPIIQQRFRPGAHWQVMALTGPWPPKIP